MRYHIIISALTFFTVMAENSHGIENNIQFISPDSLTVEFDPFSGLPAIETAELEFTVPQNLARTVKIMITPEIAHDFEFDALDMPVELHIDSPNGTQSPGTFEAIMTLQSGQSNLVDVNFKILAGQYANAGVHELNLLINVIDDITGEVLIADRPLHVECSVASRAQTNFAGTTPGFDNGIGIATLDFGQIVFGDSRQVQFQIRGNAEVNVEMSSENGGFMVNQTNAEISPIPYTVDADGVISDMRTPLTFMRRPEKSLDGSRYPLKVTIEEPEGGAYAGQYRDILSIDVTPQ